MNKYVKLSGALLVVSLILSGCTKKEETTIIQEPTPATFVGSSTCETCHSDEYTEFMSSGHPWKLNKVSDIQAAGGFASYYPSPSNTYWQQSNAGWPPGTDASQFVYVIGGWGWKARFVKTDGYIYTEPDQGQYNLETNEWVDYHGGQQKEYSCGPCHTTGYKDEGHQDGLQGIVGTWAYPGIQCERCHGAGSKHVESPYDYPMEINRSSALCGECHVRGNPYEIDAKGGFVKHHEQYEELLASKHAVFDCVDCHDPHQRSHRFPSEVNNTGYMPGIKIQCESCHYEEAEAYATSNIGSKMKNFVKCIDCHMPYAAKSAVVRGTYKGDVRSHLFAINPDSEAVFIDTTTNLANPYLTLEYTCIVDDGCHDQGAATPLTKSQAAIYADSIHPVNTLSAK